MEGSGADSEADERVYRIFISSTADDLIDHRAAVAEAIDNLEQLSVRMETFGARAGTSLEACRELAARSDLTLALVAHRYGWIPDSGDQVDGLKSITWYEVEAAKAAGKPVYPYLVDETFAWPHGKEQDELTKPEADAQRVLQNVQSLSRLKDELVEACRQTFTTPDDLAKKVSWDVARFLREADRRLREQTMAASSPQTDPSVDLKVFDTAARHKYLERVAEDHGWVEIRGMGARVTQRLPLERVYTDLRARPPFKERGPGAAGNLAESVEAGFKRQPEEREPVRLEELLPDQRVLAVIGDPGSGKTTFLRKVAHALACAGLPGGAQPEFLEAGSVLPFPIFVRMEEFGSFLGEAAGNDLPADAPEHFYRYLDFLEKGLLPRSSSETLRTLLHSGAAFLLLDGLDEVAHQATREGVSRIVERVLGDVSDGRVLISCRTRAWEGRVQLVSGHLETVELAPLEQEQIEQFVHSWCLALHGVEPEGGLSAELAQAQRYEQSLLAAIDAHPATSDLVASPLMLTMLAVVHWNSKKLPEQRADLYRVAVDYLLERQEGQASQSKRERQEALQAIALAMVEDPAGVQRSWDRAEAAKVAASSLGVDKEASHRFLEGEELHSGILVSRREGEVEFWHLTFQEFLAGLALADEDELDRWERIQENLFDDRWTEVLLLLAGCLRTQGPKTVRRFLRRLLTEADNPLAKARTVGLLGLILRDLAPSGGDPAEGTGFAAALQDAMAFLEPGAPDLDEASRLRLGEAAGLAGDPRFSPEAEAENRVHLEGGTFWLGAQSSDDSKWGYDQEALDRESPVHRVQLSDFEIARYPVTVGQYRRFLESSASAHDLGRWGHAGVVEEPSLWDRQLPYPNCPVVGVSWFEAAAYCDSVGGQLPTEAQWERAARGAAGRRYPWGDSEPDASRANFGMGRAGDVSEVGCYPAGASPGGVMDLAGNMWEWCRDWHGQYPKEPGSDYEGPGSGDYRVLRGGAFYGTPGYLRAAFRLNYHPENRDLGLGFRVVWLFSGGP